jgi:hypothetical protein
MANTETAAKPLKYSRVKGVFGDTQYMAQTSTHRFIARRSRDRRGEWTCEVWTLKAVGTIDPILIADQKIYEIGYSSTRAEAYEDIDSYRNVKGI